MFPLGLFLDRYSKTNKLSKKELGIVSNDAGYGIFVKGKTRTCELKAVDEVIL